MGVNFFNEPNYHTKEKEIGKISEEDLKRFIKWAENEDERCSKITDISVISGSFNIFEEIKKIL